MYTGRLGQDNGVIVTPGMTYVRPGYETQTSWFFNPSVIADMIASRMDPLAALRPVIDAYNRLMAQGTPQQIELGLANNEFFRWLHSGRTPEEWLAYRGIEPLRTTAELERDQPGSPFYIAPQPIAPPTPRPEPIAVPAPPPPVVVPPGVVPEPPPGIQLTAGEIPWTWVLVGLGALWLFSRR
jgi:hypothetical protein